MLFKMYCRSDLFKVTNIVNLFQPRHRSLLQSQNLFQLIKRRTNTLILSYCRSYRIFHWWIFQCFHSFSQVTPLAFLNQPRFPFGTRINALDFHCWATIWKHCMSKFSIYPCVSLPIIFNLSCFPLLSV